MCRCQRAGPAGRSAAFAARYRPAGPATYAAPGSLDCWLTERYCYYSVDGRGRPARCEIAHAPWPLQPARACIAENTLARAAGLALPAVDPLLHYAHVLRAHIWPVRAVAGTIDDGR